MSGRLGQGQWIDDLVRCAVQRTRLSLCGYDERMANTLLLPILLLLAVLGILVGIIVSGAIYVGRLRRKGTEAVLKSARKHRGLRT